MSLDKAQALNAAIEEVSCDRRAAIKACGRESLCERFWLTIEVTGFDPFNEAARRLSASSIGTEEWVGP